jgi:dihydrofolate reductase
MSPSEQITQKIASYSDWRGPMMARLRAIILEADPNLTEEWKWNTPVWSHKGLVCSVGAFKDHVKIKAQPGQDILVNGSGTLINTLIEHDLIDEYWLTIFPIVIGHGQRLFQEREQPAKLKLLETIAFQKGVMRFKYVPDRS